MKNTIQLATAALLSKGSRTRMPADNNSIPELEHLSLKILEEYNAECGEWVATCIETGAVAAAPDQDTLEKLIHETIRLEIVLAAQNGDFANLLRKPASGEIHARWLKAAVLSGGATPFTLEISFNLATPRREVKSEISIKKASYPRTA